MWPIHPRASDEGTILECASHDCKLNLVTIYGNLRGDHTLNTSWNQLLFLILTTLHMPQDLCTWTSKLDCNVPCNNTLSPNQQ